MKIHQLLDTPSIIVTNEERNFIDQYGNDIAVLLLDDHKKWLAQNLIRKGIYELSNDGRYLLLRDA